MASRGLRCIALSYRDYPSEDPARPADFFADPERVDDGLTAVAVVGIKDPVRWAPNSGWLGDEMGCRMQGDRRWLCLSLLGSNNHPQ
jgi:hypothetical protein